MLCIFVGECPKKIRGCGTGGGNRRTVSKNVEALREVQPAPLTANQISARIGANWIDEKYYKQFICELLEVNSYQADSVTVGYSAITGEWSVGRDTYLRYNLNANSVFGTKRMDAFVLFERCLNSQTPTITDEVEDADGKKKRVVNKQETIAVRERQKKLQTAFKNGYLMNRIVVSILSVSTIRYITRRSFRRLTAVICSFRE